MRSFCRSERALQASDAIGWPKCPAAARRRLFTSSFNCLPCGGQRVGQDRENLGTQAQEQRGGHTPAYPLASAGALGSAA
jgi:hypothetical protein